MLIGDNHPPCLDFGFRDQNGLQPLVNGRQNSLPGRQAVFSTRDLENYTTNENGAVWLIYRDGSKQSVDAIPILRAESSGNGLGNIHPQLQDLLAGLTVLLVILVITFITAISY